VKRSSVLSVVWSLVALAAPPPNDLCAGAEVIPSGVFPVMTSVTADMSQATPTGDPPLPSCQPNVIESVWYAFTPAATSTYYFSTCADGPTASTLDDTVIAIYSSPAGCSGPFTELAGACDDDGCTLEDFQSVVAGALTAGTTYYVVVWAYGGRAITPGNTALQLRVGKSANDVCSSASPVQLDTPIIGNTSAVADDYRLALATDGGQVCSAGIGSIATRALGRDLAYSFTPATSGKFSWRVRGAASDLVLHLANTCPAGAAPITVNSCIAVANRNLAAAEETSCVQLTGGTQYFGFVDGDAFSGGNFDLEVNACVPEVESNNTPATANALACPVTGGIVPVGDVDFYNLGSGPGRVFAAVDGLAGSSYDFDLRVTTATDVLEYDDGDMDPAFGVYAPAIAGTAITGQSYLRVSHYYTTERSEPYRLYAVVQPPSASAVAETEPNNTTAQANLSGLAYFSGALAGPSPSTDVDVFSVPAVAGDLLFVALDGDPLRNNTPLNAKLELLDASGTVLVGVNDGNATSVTTAVANDLYATSPSSPAEALMWRVRSSGTHFVRVTAGSTNAVSAAGDYLLSITRNCVKGTNGPAPTLASIAPTSGPVAGGTAVTLTGTNFVAGTTVTLGGAACAPVSGSATSLSCPTPARGVPGSVDVSITNPDGQQATLVGGFTYTAGAPTLSLVNPGAGPTAGLTFVTLTGTNFFAGATVTFGATAATSVMVTSPTTLTCFTPMAAAAGMVNVKVTNVDAQQGTLANGFEYTLPPPTLSAVLPTTGSTLGGTMVTLNGTQFQNGATVSFGGINVAVTSVSATAIVATTSAHAAGSVSVLVKNPDNQTALLLNGFTFVTPPPPTVTMVAPSNGFASGGTGVTITGSDFVPGSTVEFGGSAALNVAVTSASVITASTPVHLAGAVDVVVTTPSGQVGALPNGFTFIAVPGPALTAINPMSGAEKIATPVILTGNNFQNGATVTFGGTLATGISVVSLTQISCSTPALLAGPVDVLVRNPDNQTAMLSGGYTFLGPDAGTDAGAGDAGSPDAGQDGGGSDAGAGKDAGGAGGGGGSSGSGGGGASMIADAGGAGSVPAAKGCGCNQADAGTLALAGISSLALLRRRRSSTRGA
jgi:hypothetical protein